MRNAVGTEAYGLVFLQLFRVLPNFAKQFYNSVATLRECVLSWFLESSPKEITNNTTMSASLSFCGFIEN